MTIPIADTEPTGLRAGDSWQWNKSFEDYPASTWTLTYFLRGPSVLDSDGFDASADGDNFQIRQNAAYSESFQEGLYTLVGRVTDGTDAKTVFEDSVYIVGNPLAGAGAIAQTQDELVYGLILAAIAGRVPKDRESFMIEGRTIVSTPILDLERLRGIYAGRIEQQRAGSAGLGGPVVEVVF